MNESVRERIARGMRRAAEAPAGGPAQPCNQCGVAWNAHPAGDGLEVCPGDFDPPERDWNAEAFFAITAATEEDAKQALALATGLIWEALKGVPFLEGWPAGATIALGLEDEHGGVEPA
jgi:hypothetical protein